MGNEGKGEVDRGGIIVNYNFYWEYIKQDFSFIIIFVFYFVFIYIYEEGMYLCFFCLVGDLRSLF